ncbi:hypothetical protein ACIP66_03065 [Pseudomonas sp. NPDC088429]|uniref:hypothetical protein n=1 Tax=Pseudomonas sp. NPDC088429 TaxID=3364455 RepID=UPI003830BFC3
MPLIKAVAVAKARSHFHIFADARKENAFKKLYHGALGYCRSLRQVGLIDEAELQQLLMEAQDFHTEWYRQRLSIADGASK